MGRVTGVSFPKASLARLRNGARLHELPFGDGDIVRVDCVFKAGALFQPQLLVASFAGQMMREGTRTHSSSEIAEALDSHGASLAINVSYESACVTLYALTRHLEPMLRLLTEIVTEPAYPEKEFTTYLNKRKQQFLIQNERVSTLASRNLNAALFGPKSLYGSAGESADFDRLDTDMLKRFHQVNYTFGDCDVIVSGKVDDKVCGLIDATLGAVPAVTHDRPVTSIYVRDELNASYRFAEKADSVQSAILMGSICMSAKDPDYHAFSVLNTVLGGYFGSRLMSNVREEKGFTYGIGSYVWSLPEMGRFTISTQTATEYVEPAIGEIKKEMSRLCESLILADELDSVRSYMLGENARVLDGSFSFVDAYLSFLSQGVDGTEFYRKSEETILSVTADELIGLARKYFDMERFCISVAGQKTK